jgi:hypothetical protein
LQRVRAAITGIAIALPIVLASAHSAAAGSSTIDGQYSATGKISAGVETTMVVVGRGGVPSTGVGAVALNVTVTEASAASFLTVWPTGSPRPLASNLNVAAGQTVANSVITKVGANGSISIFNNSGAAHVIVDVLGWFPTSQSYVGLTPARLADTRSSPTVDGQASNTGPIQQNGVNNVTVTGRGGVPGSGVGAVALNVTATDATRPSFIAVWPAGAARPTASNLNVVVGQTVPNMVIAKVGANGQVSIYNDAGSVNVIVDVLGWFPTGAAYNAMVPARVLDTRATSSIVGGATTDVPITGQAGGPPAGATAVALNVTVTQPSGPSYLTAWPSGAARPLSSNLNFVEGQTVPNMVIVKLGTGGKISLFTETPNSQVVVDVMGYFTSASTFNGLVPARLMDTRGGASGGGGRPMTPGTSWQWQVDGQAIDLTALDGSSNLKKMFDIDMFTSSASTISQLHAKGIYVVCYMETGSWEDYRPDAGAYPASVLGSPLGGYPNERLVDIRQIAVLQPIMSARLDLAKSKGCDGIEPDLDDTYTYSTGFPLTMQHQLAFNRMVADQAHARGMSIGLKNGTSSGGVFEKAMEPFTDWALNEECNQYGECGGYSVYIAANKAVFQVEYLNSGSTAADVCPKNNAANYDGILKASSESLNATPRIACRNG